MPVKDSVATADLPTTAGTAALRDFHPAADATVVARLRAAGAIVLGKTNLHELSFGWTSNNLTYGPVHNPWDRLRIPGGSSGGTAAAVAAGMAPLGVAEDTQGSIRVPAALCGVAGFRPTTGRYPNDGCAPISGLFDQIGPIARHVADLALFVAVMTGDDSPIETIALDGLRLVVAREYFFTGLDPSVAVVICGPIPAAHGVVRWRLIDLVQWIRDEFAVSISTQTLSRDLRAMGYRKLTARPRHHAQGADAIDVFKKISLPSWQRSGRSSLAPHP